MKLIFFFLVLLKNGIHPTEGLRVFYSSEGIILKYLFLPYYNSYQKCCCKFYQSGCIIFVNDRGQFNSLYRGRIFITNYYGEFEVKITNLNVMDAGRYRCGVVDFPATYQDVEVTVSDFNYFSGVATAPLLPKSSIKPTVWPSSSPSTTISKHDAETISSDSWRTSYTLAAVVSVLVFAVISMTLLVYCLKTRKKKSTDKSEICGFPNTTLEQNGIIYSSVNFQPHQDPFELYANLQIQNPRCTFTVEESVEYSAIMTTPA
ncbi:uncharacterized protein LOC127169290 isoform X4 [Labeo rohita]|uniref:uncharacterized protein LOC127169290 isoform X1 n=1 Tax=Labeo rohita TaxID=84645 RepID=UPI0021E2FEE9|nr:uncharacterized protein LOC127169290 isoform X1 [Labeo rohita]XP_050972494.1 uncharacterized protein LOC127169290 isoform X3 [Labeo rohita]XP_050972495.1 uncharacterized protein LOC127169290 isoform X4 [Labeo rohita]